jgi:hypothetical protein
MKYGKKLEIQPVAKGIHVPLATHPKSDLDLGQFTQKRIHGTFNLPSLYATRGIHGAFTKSMSL